MKITKKILKFWLISAQILIIITSGALTAYAQGVLLINTDIEELDNVFILDADDTGGDIKLQFGATLDKYLQWDSASEYFSFNDDIDLQGNEIKNVRLDNLALAPTCDGTVIGRIYHNTADSNSYICNGTSWEQIDVVAGSAITGIDSNTFTIDQDDTGGDVSLIFGTTLAESLTWDDTNQRFVLSDDFVPSVDNAYSLGTEDYRWSNIYAVSGITIENGDVSVGEGGFVISFVNGETGTGNTILPGNVLKVDITEANAVELTTSQNDQPIGVAKNTSAYGEEVEAIIIGKGTVSCAGSIPIGGIIQTSNVAGAVKEGANSTKVVGTAVTVCDTGYLDAIIHLE